MTTKLATHLSIKSSELNSPIQGKPVTKDQCGVSVNQRCMITAGKMLPLDTTHCMTSETMTSLINTTYKVDWATEIDYIKIKHEAKHEAKV